MYVILGAGAAGLSVAYFLRQSGIRAMVLEQGAIYGGLARSFQWHGFWCDFGAHRFYTDDMYLLGQVRKLVPLYQHQRRSKIYLLGTWLHDPLNLVEVLQQISPSEAVRVLSGYLWRNRQLPENSFEDYVLKRYGQHIYDICFRCYTERLFSLSGHQISVEWARRKVRLASPLDQLRAQRKKKFRSFYYPVEGGYGAIVSALYRYIHDQVIMHAKVTRLESDETGLITAVGYEQEHTSQCVTADHIISTLPLTITARLLGLDVSLDYQKVDAVYLLLNRSYLTDNHWLYFMDGESVINRIVEFKHMSLMDPAPDRTVVCAEVTRHVDDPVAAVIENLERVGLLQKHEVLDTLTLHEPFAYPRYSREYPSLLKNIDQQLNRFRNLHILGRAAQFDHLEVDDVIGAAYVLVQQVLHRE
jgi:protoporphyrinogen oxidase